MFLDQGRRLGQMNGEDECPTIISEEFKGVGPRFGSLYWNLDLHRLGREYERRLYVDAPGQLCRRKAAIFDPECQ